MPRKPKIVRVRMTLSIGMTGDDREEIVECNAKDVPEDDIERAEWLHAEWKEWSGQFIEGGSTILEEKRDAETE